MVDSFDSNTINTRPYIRHTYICTCSTDSSVYCIPKVTMTDTTQSAYHFTQADACFHLAKQSTTITAICASFRQLAHAHADVGRALLKLEKLTEEHRRLEEVYRTAVQHALPSTHTYKITERV